MAFFRLQEARTPSMMEDHTKTIMFTTNNLQGAPTIQYQTQDQAMKQQNVKIEGQKDQQFPTFSYNLNKIQMLMPQGQHSTVNLAQLSDDNKTIQYIAQPYFGNYALVNGAPMQMQMTNGVTGITMDGRQLVVNKPITAVSAVVYGL